VRRRPQRCGCPIVGSQECAQLAATGEKPETVSDRVKLSLNSGVRHLGVQIVRSAPLLYRLSGAIVPRRVSQAVGVRKSDAIDAYVEARQAARCQFQHDLSACAVRRGQARTEPALLAASLPPNPALFGEPAGCPGEHWRVATPLHCTDAKDNCQIPNSRQTSCRAAHRPAWKSPFVSDFSAELTETTIR